MKVTELMFMVMVALAIALGGITYIKQHNVVDVPAFEVTATEKQHTSVLSIVGGVAVVSGLLLLAGLRRRHA